MRAAGAALLAACVALALAAFAAGRGNPGRLDTALDPRFQAWLGRFPVLLQQLPRLGGLPEVALMILALAVACLVTRSWSGAVLVVGHNGQVVYRKAYGKRALVPQPETMTVDTVFDCASLTKVIATTSSMMKLFEQGKFRLNDKVTDYIPEFQGGKSEITLRNLGEIPATAHFTVPRTYEMLMPHLRSDARLREVFVDFAPLPISTESVDGELPFG